MEDKKESNKVKLTGLWDNVTANGDTYMSGSLGTAKVLIFKNTFKDKDKDPDWNMFLAPKEKKPEDQPAPLAPERFRKEDEPF